MMYRGRPRDGSGALVLAALIFHAGCVTVDEQQTAANYVMAGSQAELRGDWTTARSAYQGALANGGQSQLPVRARAMLELNYGRSLGVTCRFDEAEERLQAAYRLDREAGGPAYIALLELGRLNFGRKRYDAAAGYFGEGVAEIERAGIAARAPAEFANVLDEYAVALAGAERASEAAAVWQQAAGLRRKDPTLSVIAGRTPYGTQCLVPEITVPGGRTGP